MTKKNRLMLVATAALCASFITAHAANMQAAAPTRAQVAAGIGAHLASVPAGNPAALLASIQNRITAPNAAAGDVFAGVSILNAVTNADKSSSLEMYLGAENAATTQALDAVFAEVQRDPVALKQWMTARKTLEAQLSGLGKLDAASMAALWDGSLAVSADAGMPVVADTGMRDAVAQPQLAPAAKVAPAKAAPKAVPATGLNSILNETPAPEAAAPNANAAPKLSEGEETMIQQYVDGVMSLDPEDYAKRTASTNEAKAFGALVIKESAERSKLLKKPLSELSGNPVSENLQTEMHNLQDKVGGLDPSRATAENLIPRLLRMIPFVGSRMATPIQKYLRNAQSAEKAIDMIKTSLEAGRDTLIEDNKNLQSDQQRMRVLARKLRGYIAVARRIDDELASKIATEAMTPEKKKFLEEEVLFALRQRTIDLQQQLAVNEQGIIAAGLLINNNDTLIGSVNRAINTVPRALEVSAAIAIALKDQKAVLDATTAVNETVGNLITANAKALKEQGTKIHEQAVTAGIDVQKFRMAYEDLNAAIVEIARFKQEALPKMKQQIDEFAKLNIQGEQTIKRMDEAIGHRAHLMDRLEFAGEQADKN